MIGTFGFGVAYAIDLVTYAGLLVAASMMRPMPPEHDDPGADAGDTAAGWAAVKEGFAFVRGNRLVASTFAIDLVAMIFGMPAALFPMLAVTQFHRGTGDRRAAVRRAFGRRLRRRAVGGMGSPRAPPGSRRDLGGGGVGRRDRRLRARGLEPAARARLPRARRRGRRDQRDLPLDDRAARHARSPARAAVDDLHPGRHRRARGSATSKPVSWLSWFTPTISVVTGGLACIAGAGVVALAYPELRRHRSTTRT